VFTRDHQMKKVLNVKSVKQNIFSRFYTRIYIIVKTVDCLPSSSDSHAVAHTVEVTSTNNKW